MLAIIGKYLFKYNEKQKKQEAFDEMMQKRSEIVFPKEGEKWKIIDKGLVASSDPFVPGYDDYFVEILGVKRGWVQYQSMGNVYNPKHSCTLSTFIKVFYRGE